jgi:type III secretory pathway component EscV
LDYVMRPSLRFTSESNLEIQCNTHQNSNLLLHRSRKIISKIHMEAQKTLKLTIYDFKQYYREIVDK